MENVIFVWLFMISILIFLQTLSLFRIYSQKMSLDINRFNSSEYSDCPTSLIHSIIKLNEVDWKIVQNFTNFRNKNKSLGKNYLNSKMRRKNEKRKWTIMQMLKNEQESRWSSTVLHSFKRKTCKIPCVLVAAHHLKDLVFHAVLFLVNEKDIGNSLIKWFTFKNKTNKQKNFFDLKTQGAAHSFPIMVHIDGKRIDTQIKTDTRAPHKDL